MSSTWLVVLWINSGKVSSYYEWTIQDFYDPSANLFHKCSSVFQSQLSIVCQMLVCKYNVNTCLKQNICLTQIYFSRVNNR